MNSIMTIDTNPTMSSLEIADLTGKSLSHIHRDIVKMMEEVPEDDPDRDHVRYDTDQRGYMSCVHLPKELSITLVAGYSIPIRRAIVKRWQELEKPAETLPALPDFSDPVAAARAWADAKEGEIKALKELEIAAPKVEFVKRYVESEGLKGFREVAKLLKADEAEFKAFLIDSKVMYRLAGKLTAYQNHIEAGRFEVRAGIADNDHSYTTTKFTPKGVAWIAGEWGKHQAAKELSK